ncbi:hypothetical protein FisN_1Lh720 [Fistulifera solaris]|uniref:Major facilitator superfamily (MFS) profile domain-containing protein n=1 Tax=Fistulifera solaris TaxID=1519565 RepID=A0A1Z5KJH5_FISSO|nr:hypothetical protein FisN_1Lh720 [Fistulifera solaris]|eukprot:GAX26454.1 hypothetical protein FisN_1Lh720 [Fistulifera solaris]
MASKESSSMRKYYLLLLPQAFVGFVDAISFMVVAPSVVFYVRSVGGTLEQYGAVLSAFSFASFLFKPVLGYWVDQSSNFRAPYLTSLGAAMIGGLLYFVASAYRGYLAVAILFLGRLFGGMGAANATLGFTYVAQMIPQQHITKLNALLSMVRIMGMGIAPALNIFLSEVDTKLGSFHVNPLNSVGLFLLASNFLSFLVIYFMLEEPPIETKPDGNPTHLNHQSSQFWKEVLAPDITLPILGIFVLNANFQLVETGLAPAAKDILDWDPVQISTVFGVNAFLMLAVIALTFKLSSAGVSDFYLLEIGWLMSSVGYGALYLLWKDGVTPLAFVTPFFVAAGSFPFLGAPTRSIFTKSVAKYPTLKNQQGTMQAIMSMSASVAGFVAPGILAAFALRTPEEVARSDDKRAFTPLASFAGFLSVILLVGFVLLRLKHEPHSTEDESGVEAHEGTSLLAVSQGDVSESSQDLNHPRVQAYRRQTVSLMGITQITFGGSDVADEEDKETKNDTTII